MDKTTYYRYLEDIRIAILARSGNHLSGDTWEALECVRYLKGYIAYSFPDREPLTID